MAQAGRCEVLGFRVLRFVRTLLLYYFLHQKFSPPKRFHTSWRYIWAKQILTGNWLPVTFFGMLIPAAFQRLWKRDLQRLGIKKSHGGCITWCIVVFFLFLWSYWSDLLIDENVWLLFPKSFRIYCQKPCSWRFLSIRDQHAVKPIKHVWFLLSFWLICSKKKQTVPVSKLLLRRAFAEIPRSVNRSLPGIFVQKKTMEMETL